jgi:hypothetical protein
MTMLANDNIFLEARIYSLHSGKRMKCFHCGRLIEVKERIGFRNRCAGCDRPVHVCLNCDFYAPGYNNECRESQAERVVDKERANFCEYFAPLQTPARTAGPPSDEARAKLDALFKKKH